MDYVWLRQRRNRGWPWPENSIGLASVYGDEGWCGACGVPRGPQVGPLTLQKTGLRVEGAWKPYWLFDFVCLASEVAAGVAALAPDLEMRPIAWAASSPGDAVHLVPMVTAEPWFDARDLRAAALAEYGEDGVRCESCGVWKWVPLAPEDLPPLRCVPDRDGAAMIAAPEWFGAGLGAFRRALLRRDVAEFIVRASPRDFLILEVQDGK